MKALNFPQFDLKLRHTETKSEVFDVFRNKFVSLTPEEWVRQNLLHFLVKFRDFPQTLVAVEKNISVNGLQRRFDAVVFNKSFEPVMIIECKAPNIAINQSVFDQVCAYNQKLGVNHILISNGLVHVCIKKHPEGAYAYLQDVPEYSEIID